MKYELRTRQCSFVRCFVVLELAMDLSVAIVFACEVSVVRELVLVSVLSMLV